MRKVGGVTNDANVNVKLLTEDASFHLIKMIALYPEKILDAAKRYEPSIVARYIISLSTTFNRFYQECNIMNAKKDIQEARLVLVELTQQIIKDAMGLLGISCPEVM